MSDEHSPKDGVTSPQIMIDQPQFESILGQRKRKPGFGGITPGASSKLSDVKESDENPKVYLQLKHNPSLHKRLSLTPESKHRERPGLQSSHSLELGSLPTWRGKQFINLHNYWTGEQQSDRLHHQAPQVCFINQWPIPNNCIASWLQLSLLNITVRQLPCI